jgi:putative oxidoreductase
MNITLWIVQILLAMAFGMAGYSKVFESMSDLARMMPWTTDVSHEIVRFIGSMELLGCLGLILPSMTRIKPSLTIAAAYGLLTIMVLASLFHISRGEYMALPVTFTLGAMAGFVAWGRSRKAPIHPHIHLKLKGAL